ncbi:MAG: hypothetical protein O9327_04920 [Polaromonas sp.]|nr:hypothetical protein [Polaromonas sp.]
MSDRPFHAIHRRLLIEVLGRRDSSVIAGTLAKHPGAMLNPINAHHLLNDGDMATIARAFPDRYGSGVPDVRAALGNWSNAHPDWLTWSVARGQTEPLAKLLEQKHPDDADLMQGRLLPVAMQISGDLHRERVVGLLLDAGADPNGHWTPESEKSISRSACRGLRPLWVLNEIVLNCYAAKIESVSNCQDQVEDWIRILNRLKDAGVDLHASMQATGDDAATGRHGISTHTTVIGSACRAIGPIENRWLMDRWIDGLYQCGANVDLWRVRADGLRDGPASAQAIDRGAVAAAVALVRNGGSASWDGEGGPVDAIQAAHNARWRGVDVALLADTIMKRAIQRVEAANEHTHGLETLASEVRPRTVRRESRMRL